MNDNEVVARMNNTLAGQEGFVLSTERNNRLMPVGELIEVKLDGRNILFRFSKELVLFFTPLRVISVVNEKTETGYSPKDICDELYINHKTFIEVLGEIFRKSSKLVI